ncbi:uncharacterized protein BCR38DRAFT_414572 [Pseudomassariella vexata]|uniref:Uncharacterized protein n=1 Tax=Pseudomassariella vexata TaxID=1141098 RepID=A0A1Y2DAW7_9PEZI|nr:uncharacterized protein BCR38DRAFT_414572 [Pseudomassariella vexata]ORY56421.1 hypothetical protein BCR38DRAFT_414572 [Pseudomassariella vexata]
MPRRPSITVQAQHHWVYEAHLNEEARALAESLNLNLPQGSPGGLESSLLYPLRRLIVTGQDTLGNMQLLFGVTTVPDLHAEAREIVLVDSAAHMNVPSAPIAGSLDDGCPYWAPRPASPEEEDEIRRHSEFSRNYAAMLPWASGALNERPKAGKGDGNTRRRAS